MTAPASYRHNGRPSPSVASTIRGRLGGGNVLRLAVREGPDFIHLDALARQVAQMLVLIGRASRAEIDQQLGDRVLGRAGDAHRGADRVAFHEAADDLGALGCGEPVHASYVVDN